MDFEGTSALKVLLKILIVIVALAVVAVKVRATDGAKCIDDDEINLFMNPDEQTAGKEIYRFNYGGENKYIAEWNIGSSTWKVKKFLSNRKS